MASASRTDTAARRTGRGAPPPSRLDAVLGNLARERATGALRVGRAGTIYITGGRITYAESVHVPGVEDLLTASGRVAAAVVTEVRRAAAADGGETLVRQGTLTRGELQFCVLGATLDAAFSLHEVTGARPRFREGDRHWLGPQWYFDVAGLSRECRRRRLRLDHAWPSPALDTRPVVPAPRVTADRVVLTAVQWEVIVHADATATPADLARRLGRPVYPLLLAVRQLAAAGLLVPPAPANGTPGGPPPADPPAPGGAAAADGASGELPRREKGASRPAGAPPAHSADGTDVGVLIRLRDALERLL
ncbi:hypothetical protein ABGB17_04000 [Sphaerisporangium sp. B11E5]|uniref:hypothetical protein n=1 Tax=Sphaerisporangium sp. B11E5 TaxID=3153563 RepID=UPI00325E649A